jgi:hypothetical protein
MFGLSFEERATVAALDAPRADIALFVGWCAWRSDAFVTRELERWFDARFALTLPEGSALPFDRPLPFDTWAQFDAVADWRGRPVSAGGRESADTTLGVAVRDFFANGGRRCYAVAVDTPWPLLELPGPDERTVLFERLLPPFIDRERTSWRGLGHLKALDDVAQVLLPDLPEIAASQRDTVEPSRDAVDPPEVFVECAPRIAPRTGDPGVLRVAVPRCDDEDYARWRRFTGLVNNFSRSTGATAARCSHCRCRRAAHGSAATRVPRSTACTRASCRSPTRGSSRLRHRARPKVWWLRTVRSPG